MNKKMILKILAKISIVYLFIIAVYYLLLSISSLMIPFGISIFNFIITLLGFFGYAVGIIPVRFIGNDILQAVHEANFNFFYLGILGIILSILGIASLLLSKSKTHFIYIWYFLSFFSFLIVVDNIFILNIYRIKINIFVCIYLFVPLTQFLATIILHRGLVNQKVNKYN